jgi:hypothetical protein
MSDQANTIEPGRIHRLRAFDDGRGTFTLIDTETSTLYEWRGGGFVDVYPSDLDALFEPLGSCQHARHCAAISVSDRMTGKPIIRRDLLAFRDHVEDWLTKQEVTKARRNKQKADPLG